MVNAVAAAVHGVDAANLVVAGRARPLWAPEEQETAVVFGSHRSPSCAPCSAFRRAPTRTRHATTRCTSTCGRIIRTRSVVRSGTRRLPDDVELGDMPRMRALLKAGVRLHHIVSANPVQFWVTEFGWDTNPPRKHAASLSLASPLDGGVAAPDVAVGSLSGDVVPDRGLSEPEPVPERPLLPRGVDRECAPQTRAHGLSVPLRRVSRQEDGQRVGQGCDERQGDRHDSAPAREER